VGDAWYCDYITKPRIEACITGISSDGKEIIDQYKYNDVFPISNGFEENAEFFSLSYHTPVSVGYNLAFSYIAPLLWMRAGSQGRRIDEIPSRRWEVADTYALLVDLDQSALFIDAVSKCPLVRLVYIVTDDERRFQAIVRQLSKSIEPVRLYESYLKNFQFTSEV
jgi:adenine-specific DNA-methyltransferase